MWGLGRGGVDRESVAMKHVGAWRHSPTVATIIRDSSSYGQEVALYEGRPFTTTLPRPVRRSLILPLGNPARASTIRAGFLGPQAGGTLRTSSDPSMEGSAEA